MPARKGIHGNANQDPMVPRADVDRVRLAYAVLRDATFNLTIQLLLAQEEETGRHTDRWRTLARNCLVHLVEGTPFRVKIPNDVYQAVKSALQQTCGSTGFVVPARPQTTKRKKHPKRR